MNINKLSSGITSILLNYIMKLRIVLRPQDSENNDEQKFKTVTKHFFIVSLHRNNIPRKQLSYRTPVEYFLNYTGKDMLSV